MIAPPDRGLRKSADVVRIQTVLFTDRDEFTGAEIRLPGGWQVEADVIDAIRGGPRSELTDFAAGVRSMKFTEAVEQIARTGSLVTLPLGAT